MAAALREAGLPWDSVEPQGKQRQGVESMCV